MIWEGIPKDILLAICHFLSPLDFEALCKAYKLFKPYSEQFYHQILNRINMTIPRRIRASSRYGQVLMEHPKQYYYCLYKVNACNLCLRWGEFGIRSSTSNQAKFLGYLCQKCVYTYEVDDHYVDVIGRSGFKLKGHKKVKYY